jgi:sulfate adenylyltransferase (ADP) / ATP adenylyltransferase
LDKRKNQQAFQLEASLFPYAEQHRPVVYQNTEKARPAACSQSPNFALFLEALSRYSLHMAEQNRLFKPGTLHTTLLERTAHALACGAIHSIPTTSEIIEEGDVAFQVRIVTALAEKEQAKALAQPKADPFLPYDPDLFVTELSPTHVALLNKFNVVEHHLLLVTRAFEEQQTLLSHKDCEALLMGLADIDGLVFYNAGPAAGASQPHKHLQLIPLPASTGPRLPMESLLRSARRDGDLGVVPGMPFLHAYALMEPEWIDPAKDAAASFLARYRTMLRKVGLPIHAVAGGTTSSPPYNLLVTRQWILLVPRSREYFEHISVNALGFAGMLLVKDDTQLATLRKRGPMTALQEVALPQVV